MEALRTETLHLFKGGMAAVMIDDELAACYKDIVEREGLKKARTVKVAIKLTPRDDSDEVDVAIDVNSTIPANSTERRVKLIRGRQAFGFELDTDAIHHSDNQSTLPYPGDDSDE